MVSIIITIPTVLITKKSVKNMKNIQFLQDFSRESVIFFYYLRMPICGKIMSFGIQKSRGFFLLGLCLGDTFS